MPSWEYFDALKDYYANYDSVAKSKAGSSRLDALPTRSHSTIREAGTLRNRPEHGPDHGLSRYNASRQTGQAASSYRTAARTKHRSTNRD